MNINQRIAELGSGGLPRYNNKCNELARAVNWLLGMQTSAGPVSDGGRGPIINVPAAATNQGSQPWLTDPDGKAAGWSLITGFDIDGSITGYTNSMYKAWMWTGGEAKNIVPCPWLVDPSNKQAGWIVCTDNTFWGTGQCSGTGTTCPNFAAGVYNSSDHGTGIITNPYWTTYTAPNIAIPTSCNPKWYWKLPPNPTDNTIPCLYCGGSAGTYSYTFTGDYDGTRFFNASGNVTIQSSQTSYLNFSPAGMVFDPSGLPGYSHGSTRWIYKFNGNVSNNPNAVIKFNFSYSGPGVIFFTDTGDQVVFMSP
jgi:hypothetical protein